MTATREAAMEAALLKTRQLVCEAAEVGFNYADGDWADRLYRNNGNIAAALSTPAADTRVVAVALVPFPTAAAIRKPIRLPRLPAAFPSLRRLRCVVDSTAPLTRRS